MFKTKHRPDGTTYTCLVDTAPEWLREAVYEAHDGEMPNEWRYEKCAGLWDAIIDEANGGVEPYELAEDLIDVYTTDLLAWLTPCRVHYVDTAITEFGDIGAFQNQGSLAVRFITIGQGYALDQMALTLTEAYTNNQEEEVA